MCRGAGGGGAATSQSALLEAQLDAGPGCQRRLALRVRRRWRGCCAPGRLPARLIAASRSGLGVRRSALSGVRPSACCTPALHRRRAPAKAAHGVQLEAPNCAVPLEEAPAQEQVLYACLPIRWHGSPCGPALCVRWCTSSAWRTSASAAR